MSSWTAAWVNEGWRGVLGEGGRDLMFSAKLERWPSPPELAIAALRIGGDEVSSRDALVDLRGSLDDFEPSAAKSAILFQD